jgi:Ca2+-binding RTX toxin-like protein
MAILSASTATELMAVIKLAQPGDEIRLAPGQYAAISLMGIVPAGNITITSADPANPAIFSSFTVSASSNLTISNVKMVVPDQSLTYYHFQVLGSSNIKIVDTVFDGPGLNPIQATTGLLVRNSTGVSIDSSEFKNLYNGVCFIDNTQISVTNSTFHDIQCDGIRGGGNSQVYYGYNYFTNFYPQGTEHADGIQIWTTGVTTPATDITIEGNVIVRGEGKPIQGIFIRDANLTLPFTNVTVKDNLLIGGAFNSLHLNGVISGTVTGNTVLAFPDQEAWFRTLNGADALQIYGNTASKYVTYANELVDNSLTGTVSDGGIAAIQAWAASHTVPGGLDNWQNVMILAGLAEPISGSTPPPTVAPPPADPVLNGTDGDDVLVADVTKKVEIHGNGGNDKIVGNGFGAKMLGGVGNDRYDVKGIGDMVQEDAGNGLDWVDSWIDYVLPDSVENLSLKVGGLKGHGNGLNNQITGSDGIDQLFGLGGDDLLSGGLGNDVLDGGDGNDMLNGGAGIDKLWGGAGIDYFAFGADSVRQAAPDEVMDFARGVDKLDLSGIDANTAIAGDQAFRLIGTKSFSRKAGELQVKAYGDGVLVAGDINGDGVADFSVWVHGVSKLGSGDFVL